MLDQDYIDYHDFQDDFPDSHGFSCKFLKKFRRLLARDYRVTPRKLW
jgi:hypothetical protein